MLDVINLIWPIATALFLTVLATLCLFSQKLTDSVILNIKVPLPKIGNIIEVILNVCLNHRIVKTVVLYTSAIPFAIAPIYTNYESYFPKHLKLKAHFDNSGIQNTINSIGVDELNLKGYKIDKNWQHEKEARLNDLNMKIATRYNTNFIFCDDTHGEGTAYIKAEKCSNKLSYDITEGNGNIHWKYRDASFSTEFKLKSKSLIRLSPADIYLKWGTIITPEYEQTISVSPINSEIHMDIIALTKVKMLPEKQISNSLYVYKTGNDTYVPIGYAEYSF